MFSRSHAGPSASSSVCPPGSSQNHRPIRPISRRRNFRRDGTSSSTASAITASPSFRAHPRPTAFSCPRQSNEFYYLCGIETPHAYLILDGRDRKATLLLPPRDARLESAEGKVISADDAELVKQITGVAAFSSAKEMTEEWMRQIDRRRGHSDLHAVRAGRRQRPEPRRAAHGATRPSTADPWDGRPSREAHFQTAAQDAISRRRRSATSRRFSTSFARSSRRARSRSIRRASAARRPRLDRGHEEHAAGRIRVSARRRGPLRLPRRRRAPRGLSLDHRRGHRQHLEHALLPQHGRAQGRRPGPDGFRSRSMVITPATSRACGR